MLRDGVDMLSHHVYKILIIILAGVISFSWFSPAKKVQAIGVTAQSAILMEQESGRVLYAKNGHQQMRIASITKIMTAILAVESGKLDETVKISNKAAGTEGSSLYLKSGEQRPLEELVYGLMLRSGNDAAVAIAEYVGGSLDGFIYMMNEKAQQIGMRDTVFSNPHGLDEHEEHYSSAYDMALLTQYAMKNPDFQKIFGTKRYKGWKNKNKLLTGLYQYSTGGKTGYTKLAKRTLVSTAKKDGMSLIAVTINDGDDWNDHISMFNWAFKNYHLVTLISKGEIDDVKSKFYRGKVEVVRELKYPVTNDEKKELYQTMTFYKPPKDGKWEEGYPPKPVGKLKVFLGEEQISNLPIYFKGTVKDFDQPTFIESIKDVIGKFLFIWTLQEEATDSDRLKMFWDGPFYG